jgi:YidC/Oxa1 family membrane protein insertase
MAEPVNGGSGSKPSKEMSMEMRLLLAFLLMGGVMFVSQYFMKSQAPPPAEQKAAQTGDSGEKKAPEAAKDAPAPAAPAEAKVDAAPAPGATPERNLPPLVIDTDYFTVAFSNQGGTVRSWLLKTFKGNDQKPLELVNTTSTFPPPFSLAFPGDKPAKDVNWTWYEQTVDPDGLGVQYQYSDGHTNVRKSFRFQKNSYLAKVTTEVTIDGKPVPHRVEWRGGFGDLTVAGPSANGRTLYFDVAENKLTEKMAGDAKGGPVAASGNFSFAGLADNYFAAVFLPEGNAGSLEVVTTADTTRTTLEQTPQQFPGVAISQGAQNRFEVFVGPKDLELLEKVNPKLTQVVDFGWFSILAKPLFLIVNWFNNAFVHNYGWSIVLVTVVLNFMLFPLKLTSMKSMRKMQALKPQIDAINAKYKELKMTDPRKQNQQQEVMDLYKKNGVNPMGGCVPMLLQLPFFFAFYQVFTKSVEMRGAPWLWVTDLSQPETLAIKILPILMIASQFVMQKMTPTAGADPTQAKMMLFMPLLFGYMFYWFPSGLVLYYLTSNLVSMGQQWFFNKTDFAMQAAASVEPPKKKSGRK